MLVRYLSDPARYCGRKKADLQVFVALSSNCVQDALDVFFKAQFEHLVSFIKDHSLDMSKIDVTPLNMVEDTAGCADEYLNAPFELTSLILN